MTIEAHWPLACPLDGLPLQNEEHSWRCPRGHCFDVARQGYINLLAAQHKRSKSPGDSKAMVAARAAFLRTGLYRPIADAIAEQMVQHSQPGALTVADMGCGEGYYLSQLVNQLAERHPARMITALGIDISKWAILAAAKQSTLAGWVVASNRNPPLLDDSVDWLLSVFGFAHFDGFQKPLKPGGQLLMVDAGPGHLLELRQQLYETVKVSEPPALEEAFGYGFSLAEECTMSFTVALESQQSIHDLLSMTPHYYRADKEKLAKLLARSQASTTAEVVIRRLQYQPV